MPTIPWRRPRRSDTISTVNNASLWLDLRVLFETVKTVLLARGFESASKIS
jgi:lipopolysaccharide/colanic/teichoic acid biosynthesis glycosyltransferase